MKPEDQEALTLRMLGAEAREIIKQRDAAIVQAVAGGRSLRDVAALVGLSHAGVARIVARADRRDRS
jgi:transposase-like protein